MIFLTGKAENLCPSLTLRNILGPKKIKKVDINDTSLSSFLTNTPITDRIFIAGEISGDSGCLSLKQKRICSEWWDLTTPIDLVYAHVCNGHELFEETGSLRDLSKWWVSFAGKVHLTKGNKVANRFTKRFFNGLFVQIGALNLSKSSRGNLEADLRKWLRKSEKQLKGRVKGDGSMLYAMMVAHMHDNLKVG